MSKIIAKVVEISGLSIAVNNNNATAIPENTDSCLLLILQL